MDANTAAETIENEYQRLRNLWFGVPPDLALLQFVFLPQAVAVNRLGPTDWGFDHSKNVLTCGIEQAAIEDEGLANTSFEDFANDGHEAMYRTDRLVDWAGWRINLVHELCHEFEFKVLEGIATQEGWDLFHRKVVTPNAKPKWTPRWKHPVAFYSAIAAFAGSTGIDVDRLHDRL